MRVKHSIKYETKDNKREINIKLTKDDTTVMIMDNDKLIGTGIKLEKDVAISLASKILKFYNRDFIFSDKIRLNLEKIEAELEETYTDMIDNNSSIYDDQFLDLKDSIIKLIKEIK